VIGFSLRSQTTVRRGSPSLPLADGVEVALFGKLPSGAGGGGHGLRVRALQRVLVVGEGRRLFRGA
jgi:hypothetical protein